MRRARCCSTCGVVSWSDEMVAALQLDPRMLPPVRGSAGVTGDTHRRCRGGIGPETGHSGCRRRSRQRRGRGRLGRRRGKGAMQASIGTSGTMLAPIDRPRVDPGMRLHLFNHAVADMWYQMGVVLSAGAALAWFRRALSGPKETPLSYDELIAEAARISPGADGLTFVPYLTGERTPHADSNARGVFSGTAHGP